MFAVVLVAFIHYLLSDVQTTYRVGLALCNTFQYQFHNLDWA